MDMDTQGILVGMAFLAASMFRAQFREQSLQSQNERETERQIMQEEAAKERVWEAIKAQRSWSGVTSASSSKQQHSFCPPYHPHQLPQGQGGTRSLQLRWVSATRWPASRSQPLGGPLEQQVMGKQASVPRRICPHA